jgi:hypothetical protein
LGTLALALAWTSPGWATAAAAQSQTTATDRDAPRATTLSGQRAGASLDQATADQKKAATEAYVAGKKAYDAGDFEGALAQFERSYGAVASPNSLLMLAQTLEQQGKLADAYRAYVQTRDDAAPLASDPKYRKTQEAADAAAKKLEPELGWVRIKAEGASSNVLVANRTITLAERSGEVAVTAGTVNVALLDSGTEVATKEVSVKAGEHVEVELAAPESSASFTSSIPRNYLPEQRTWAYVAGGVGAAGLLTFTIFGLLNNSQYGDLEDECSGSRCSSSLQEDADTGRTYQTVANVGLVVGLVGLGAGAALYFTSDANPDPAKDTARRSSRGASDGLRVTHMRVGTGQLEVGGSF